jgi:phospholipid transport system substrate-binding protein
VSHSNVEVELDYKLRLRNGTWKIYDLYAAGVSLTQNYKTQFEKILMNETADQLIERLRKKIAEQQGNPSDDNLTGAQP